MSYPFQIRSLEQYHKDYKKSVDDPGAFWAEVAGSFQWRKKWDSVSNGISKNPK